MFSFDQWEGSTTTALQFQTSKLHNNSRIERKIERNQTGQHAIKLSIS